MGSDSLHRLQGFKPEADAQNHCTDTAYSGPPKAAVRLTAQGGQILIERVDLCRMSQAVGPVSKTTNAWARVRISADLCRMSQAVGSKHYDNDDNDHGDDDNDYNFDDDKEIIIR